MTTKADIASVAGQLAGLTRTVEEMADELRKLQKDAVTQQERSNAQQDRIDHAARDLAEVSARLQAAADALRQAL
jgi:predicted  nucleic acid-binding Zn-ribbon protein